MIRIWNETDNEKETAEIKHANCAAYELNLCVKDAFGRQKNAISETLEKCRHIVGHMKHSSKAFSGFKRIQLELGLPSHKLLQVNFFIFILYNFMQLN